MQDGAALSVFRGKTFHMEASELGECVVDDVRGYPVRLGNTWHDRPAVIVWLRHYGCLFCKQQTKEFRERRHDIEMEDARLVFVGCGDPRYAAAFHEEFAPDCIVLTDPQGNSYRAIGARQSWFRTVGPRAFFKSARAWSKGFRQTSAHGHVGQQGGVLVIRPGNIIEYRYISSFAGDHPPVADVISALHKVNRLRELVGEPASPQPGVRPH